MRTENLLQHGRQLAQGPVTKATRLQVGDPRTGGTGRGQEPATSCKHTQFDHYQVQYSDKSLEDAGTKLICLGELGMTADQDESDATFTFRNLNYVKAKLFDPEIKYLTVKFTETFQNIKAELSRDNAEFTADYKR